MVKTVQKVGADDDDDVGEHRRNGSWWHFTSAEIRNKDSDGNCKKYSVCSLVVPTLEEAILTSVLKKNFK